MTRTLSHATTSVPESLDDIQHFVLEDASWEFYVQLLREVGNRQIRVTYDKGRLEIMSPVAEQERPKKLVGRLVDMLTFELNCPIESLGSTTLRRADLSVGVDPDECYYFEHEAKMRGRKRLDLRKDPPPELVVEIDITSRSVPREPIYAALGVPEVWRYDGLKLQCLHLVGREYRVRKHSKVFAFLEPAKLGQFIEQLSQRDENSILRSFVKWIRDNGWVASE
ncbi:MAG TPA: Uma2 family endonuclease [Humisphaera sp.]|jgi:Uma2 family endonuclease|nr:Uma2 family endonuclease [Humisphaera sp.]